MMIATVVLFAEISLAVDGAAEFTTPDDQGFVEEPAIFQVLDEGGVGLIRFLAAGGELARQAADVQVIMMGGVVRFREPDADSPARLVPIIENLVRNCTAALVL